MEPLEAPVTKAPDLDALRRSKMVSAVERPVLEEDRELATGERRGVRRGAMAFEAELQREGVPRRVVLPGLGRVEVYAADGDVERRRGPRRVGDAELLRANGGRVDAGPADRLGLPGEDVDVPRTVVSLGLAVGRRVESPGPGDDARASLMLDAPQLPGLLLRARRVLPRRRRVPGLRAARAVMPLPERRGVFIDHQHNTTTQGRGGLEGSARNHPAHPGGMKNSHAGLENRKKGVG